MDEKSILKLTRDKCIEKLMEIGQHSSGTLEEMKIRLSLHPRLHQRLKLKAQREYKFQCSLDPNEVPSISAKWCLDEKFYPAVNEDIVPLNIQKIKDSKKKLSVCYKAEKLYLSKLYGIILEYIFVESQKNLTVQQSDQLLYNFKVMYLVKQLVGALLD